MAKRSDWVKDKTDELVRFVKAQTAAGGPETRRAAALAVTNFEQGALWAGKAFTAEDFVAGDGGGATGPDRSVSANDEGLDGIDRHDGQSDP
jgi:hypothetical protein